MAQSDDPFNPGNKTVIRPRPGGMFDSGQTFGNPPQQRGQAPGSGTAFQPFGAPPASQPLGSFGSQQDWISQQSPNSQQPAPQVQRPARQIPLQIAISAHRSAEVKATNPITQAAVPLLVLLGRLRQLVVELNIEPLMQHVSTSIKEFEQNLLSQGIDSEQVQVAKYALCATADDIVQNLPGPEKQVWLQYNMLTQFFGMRTSGTVLFDKIRQLIANPSVYYNLLELIHACLSLGFEGQYRSTAGGNVELQRVRMDVFQTLRAVKPRGSEELSPRWRGVVTTVRNWGGGLPVWTIAAFAIALLVGLYILLRFLISDDGDASARSLVNIHPRTPVQVQRIAPKPIPTEQKQNASATTPLPDTRSTTQLERIRGQLSDQIAKGVIAVNPKGQMITIAVSDVLLFSSGSADVRADFKVIGDRIAAALNKEPGPIDVVGHTDNVKLRATSKFKSNFDLSVKRAEAVAKIIAAQLNKADRMKVSGKGEDDPTASNDTAEGRAKNRRVEISIPREETL